MAHQIYFNAAGRNPLEMAEGNQAFYQQFVTEYGSSPAHANLWTGEQLESLIASLVTFQKSNLSTQVITKCDANITYYKNLYKKLTTTKFTH